MSVTFSPAALRDMTYVAANMREADRREIAAVFPGSTSEIAATLLAASGDLAWIASQSGNPVCAFGIARLLPGLGSGWAYGTRHMPGVMRAVTRFCLREVRPKLLRDGFRRVEVRSALDHDLSHRWLEHLGFLREGVAVDYGAGGLDFATYATTRATGARPTEMPTPSTPSRPFAADPSDGDFPFHLSRNHPCASP